MKTQSHLPSPSDVHQVMDVVNRYFDFIYFGDLEIFDDIFHPESHLYGFKDDAVLMWSAGVYRSVVGGRESPSKAGSARRNEVLTIDWASSHHASAKVRVSVHQTTFVDYLTMIKSHSKWQIVSKTYRAEATE